MRRQIAIDCLCGSGQHLQEILFNPMLRLSGQTGGYRPVAGPCLAKSKSILTAAMPGSVCFQLDDQQHVRVNRRPEDGDLEWW
jgi:hypothetical protein